MKVIDPELFYRYLITNEGFSNDLSLFSKNTYLDENGKLQEHFSLDISNQSGEWLENQINSMNTEEDDDEVTYGNFQYLSTVVDESAMFPQYSEIFSLNLICLEKYREKYIKIFDDFAAQLNNAEDQVTIYNEDTKKDDLYDIYIQLGGLTTPDYGEKQDIGGCERFILTLSFIVRITTNIVTSKSIKLYHYTDEEGDTNIRYINFEIQRSNDMVEDNKAGYERKYDVNKSDFSMVISALYVDSTFGNKIMDYLIDPSKANIPVYIHYVDEASGIKSYVEGNPRYNREQTYQLVISAAKASYEFGRPVSYTVSLKTSMEDSLTGG